MRERGEVGREGMLLVAVSEDIVRGKNLVEREREYSLSERDLLARGGRLLLRQRIL